MAVFDTLRAARKLRAAGFGDAQAEAVAEVVQAVANGNRVSKVDLRDFATKADFDRFASRLDLERFATKEDLKRFATKEDLERFATKAELQELELRLTIRTGVMIASSSAITTGLIVGLIRLLP